MKTSRILVWDLPLRVFHWLLAISFVGAFLTAESERVRDVHVVLGYTVLGLLAFRLLWGFLGTRHARWSSFAYGPGAVLRYLRSLFSRRPSARVRTLGPKCSKAVRRLVGDPQHSRDGSIRQRLPR